MPPYLVYASVTVLEGLTGDVTRVPSIVTIPLYEPLENRIQLSSCELFMSLRLQETTALGLMRY
jgi:hypothetical protein